MAVGTRSAAPELRRRRAAMMRSAPGTAAAPRRLLLFLGLSAAAALSYCGEPAAAAPSLVSRLATRFHDKDRKFMIEKAIEGRTPENSLLAEEAGYLAKMLEMRQRSSKHLITGSTLFGGGVLLGNLLHAAELLLRKRDLKRARKGIISHKQFGEALKTRLAVRGLLHLAFFIVALNGFVHLIKAGRRASDSKKLRQRAIDLLKARVAAAAADEAAEYDADTAAENVSLHGQTRQTIGMEDRPIVAPAVENEPPMN